MTGRQVIKKTIHTHPNSLAQQLKKLPADGASEARRAEATRLVKCWLDGETGRLKAEFMAKGDARGLLTQHSAVIDALLEALMACGQQDGAPSLALVAVGGYGRQELFPHSDIDLLFLHDGELAAESAQMAEFILYVLWDSGLKVGQAHRSIDETLKLAETDFTIRTNLLDARFIAGRKAFFERFRTEFAQAATESEVLAFVEAKLAERHQRHARWGDSRYMLEPNVKEGKGGLRDLHTLWWMARYAYPIEKIRDLVALKLLTDEEYQAFRQACRFLWRVRIHLHYLTGRAEERLTFDRQHAVAVAMGYALPGKTPNRAIERFMRRYFVTARNVGSMTRIFCALLEEEKKGMPRTPLPWRWAAPWLLNGFTLEGQRLSVYSENAFEENPLAMIELFHVAQMHDLDIHPRTLQLAARDLHRIDARLRQDPRANALFLDMLLSPKGPEAALRRMSDAGVLGRFIPEFGRVIGQTQFNMYHVYTVDEHTLVALGVLHEVERGNLRKDFPLASDIIHRLRLRRVLYLALFCHDIAKGQGGDHSELGGDIVARLAARLGFSAKEGETASWLVRNHLLFSNTAFKRDLSDPKTIQDFVAIVQTPERLKLLVVLTVADIRAVGPNVWNAWKGGLMRELFSRAEQAMGLSTVETRPHPLRWFKQDLLRQLPDWSEDDLEAYLNQLSGEFLAQYDIARHALMAGMVRQAQRAGLQSLAAPLLHTEHNAMHAITEITLCVPNQPGLFSKLAGAVALAGANIINAKIFTLKNGVAIDVFQVQDAAGQLFDRPRKLEKMAGYIRHALEGTLDLSGAFAAASRYPRASRNALPVPGQVFIDNDASAVYSVIEVSGHDRTGFLHQVTQAIAELNLSIATAHISTYGTQVADVFYVKDSFGMKINHEARIRQVCERLLKTVNAGVSGSSPTAR